MVSATPHSIIADLCVDVLEAPQTACATLMAMTVPSGQGADSWPALLASVQPDKRIFRTDLLGEHRRAVCIGALIGSVLLMTLVSTTCFYLKSAMSKFVWGARIASGVDTPHLLLDVVFGLGVARKLSMAQDST